MSARPRLSLVVSCYNQRPWLELLMPSIAAQQLDAPFEVILCDDGSSDGTNERVEHWSEAGRLDLRHVWQPDRGFRLSRSRNNGIHLARGEVLVFVDGDAWLPPAFLAEHWRTQQRRASLVCGLRHTLEIPDQGVEALSALRFGAVPLDTQVEHEQQRGWLATSRPWMACLACNLSVPATHAVEFDEAFTSWGSEDRDLAFRLYRAGLPVELLPLPNMIQFRTPGEQERRLTHDHVVAFLENKRYLQHKYPAGEMAASVDLIRFCQRDARTDRWYAGAFRHDATVADVFREFEEWARRQERARLPMSRAAAVSDWRAAELPTARRDSRPAP